VRFGGDEDCRVHTTSWLVHNEVSFDELHMRRHKDNRRDDVVKLELFDQRIRRRFDVRFVIDDRDQGGEGVDRRAG